MGECRWSKRERCQLRKTWWDCVKNDVQCRGPQKNNEERKLTRQPANPGSAKKIAVNKVCVCVHVMKCVLQQLLADIGQGNMFNYKN